MGKLCRDQFVERLTSLFREAPEEKVITIPDAVSLAQRRIAEEDGHAKRAKVMAFLEGQLKTLEARGCPEQIVAVSKNGLNKVVDALMKTDVPDGHILAVPVIPRGWCDLYHLMEMVRYRELKGYNHLDPSLVSDESEFPKRPYYLLDVEDGTATLGETPLSATKIVKKQNRLLLNTDGTIAVAAHSDVLSHHNLWAAASRYVRPDKVPDVYRVSDVRPKLGWDGVGNSNPRWAVPSCGSILEL